MKILKSLVALTVLSLAAGACSNKKVESSEVPVPSAQTADGKTVQPRSSDSYMVVRGDTLWHISGRFYGDHFQWPLIYKSNRDQIQDPDLIYPRQNFSLGKGHGPEEVSRARTLAANTPKYVPHTRPRQTLPVDYF